VSFMMEVFNFILRNFAPLIGDDNTYIFKLVEI